MKKFGELTSDLYLIGADSPEEILENLNGCPKIHVFQNT